MLRQGAGSDREKKPDPQPKGVHASPGSAYLANLVIQSSSEAIIAADFDGNVIYWNPAAEQIYGWKAEEMTGNNLFNLVPHQLATERTRAALNEMRTRETWTREVEVVRKDGSSFAGEVAMSQLRDEDGALLGVVAVTSDVSQRRRAEQRLAIQYAVTRLLSEAATVQAAASDVLQAICEELAWDWGSFWLVDESVGHLRCLAVWDGGAESYTSFSRATWDLQFVSGEGLLGQVWEQGESLWIEDLAQDRRLLRTAEALEAGVRSAIAVPVPLGTHGVQGVIEIMSNERVQHNAEILDMVSAAARQTALFLERQRARDSLVENESRLRRLEESNLIGIIRANLDGSISGANDAFLNMVGYSREDLAAGVRWDAMTPDEWRLVDDEIINDVLTTGRSAQKEKEYIRRDGSRVPVLLGSVQITPGSGEVVTFVVDITDRKQAEREREESLQREQTARVAALDAQEKAEQLLRVTAAFSRARTPEEIASVAIDDGMAALGASGCSFALITGDGNALQLVESAGYAAGALDGWKRTPLSLGRGFPVTECTRRGEAIWVRSREELFDRFPAAREVDFPFSASIAAIPLMSAGRPVGAINLGFDQEHDFSESERVFMETLVQFCGQALERAWLFAAEQYAREEADVAQRRAELLLEITASLSRAITPAEVATAVIDQGLPVLGVQGGVVALLNDEGTALDVIHSRGYPEASEARWRTAPIPIDRPVPLADAARRGEAVWVYSIEELHSRYPMMAELPGITASTHVAIPMIAGTRVYGVLGLIYQSAESLDQAERTYARTLARLSSQALERANLYSAEHTARLESEDAQQRLALLAEAGELLTSSLDIQTTLDLVARLMVPQIADWCAIDVVGGSGHPHRVTVMHVDPEKVRWAEELQHRYPYDPDAPTGLAHVLRTGKTEYYPDIPDEMIAAAARDEEQLEILRRIGFSSVMIVPMVARGRTLGAITLVYAESGRHYVQEDLALIEDVAYRAALAVDNARLYEESQRHAGRMDAIAAASRSFAEASHNIQAVVESLAAHVTRHVGDWAVVRLPSEDGAWLNPVAIHHPDPEAAAVLEKMFAQDPLRSNEGLTGQVATSGEAVMIPRIDPGELRQRLKPEYRKFLDSYSMYAMLIVPMRRRRQVVGTIALVRGRADQQYTDEDRRFVQNVADRAALALENAQLFHQTQEAVRLKEEFLSIASHEMRTPLTSITGFAHLLNRQVARGNLDATRMATVTNSLLSEAIRLDHLVGDLLDVSRIEQGRLDIRPEPCNLTEIVRNVVERTGEAYEYGAGREIVVDAQDNVEGIWDPTRIDQVVTNLVTNALKYSSEGEVLVTVRRDNGDSALLSVKDSGFGIPEDQKERIFEPFMRGHEAHHQASGTGLGLYITRQIVQHHGGTIDLESEPGRGTTFTVRLPMDNETIRVPS